MSSSRIRRGGRSEEEGLLWGLHDLEDGLKGLRKSWEGHKCQWGLKTKEKRKNSPTVLNVITIFISTYNGVNYFLIPVFHLVIFILLFLILLFLILLLLRLVKVAKSKLAVGIWSKAGVFLIS